MKSATSIWRIITDEPRTGESRDGATASRYFHPRGNPRRARLVGHRGRGGAQRAPRHPIRRRQQQRRVVSGDGVADRKGVRREDGNAVEHAGMARRLHDAPARGRDYRQALPPPCPRAALKIFWLWRFRSWRYRFGYEPLAHGGTGGDNGRRRWINSAVSIC